MLVARVRYVQARTIENYLDVSLPTLPTEGQKINGRRQQLDQPI